MNKLSHRKDRGSFQLVGRGGRTGHAETLPIHLDIVLVPSRGTTHPRHPGWFRTSGSSLRRDIPPLRMATQYDVNGGE